MVVVVAGDGDADGPAVGWSSLIIPMALVFMGGGERNSSEDTEDGECRASELNRAVCCTSSSSPPPFNSSGVGVAISFYY